MMTTILILGPFVLVWAIAALFYALGRRRARQLQLDEITFAQSVRQRLAPMVMARPRTWLAIKSRNPEDVARSMGLEGLQPCASGNALTGLTADQLFVSPPVNGWVVVLGDRLPNPESDIDRCFRFLNETSERVGHVQYFHGNPTLGHHAWVKVIERQVARAYVWTGETTWNQGETTLAEQKSGMQCFDYFSDDDEGAFQLWETVRQNVEQLPLLASIWSVDPVALEEGAFRARPGWVGRMPVGRSEKN
ncbi:MAG: hypothetical protein OXS32_07865 [Verrucomicrobiales bacterium]|nr:hypothetical protein [Verrucomicrobiales bacterium]|tara:strand:- start:260 stop:1006 length:747 start_codon:yes stop_codon:yes gene_type:complete